ncbi:stimulator of interferon genes protein-like [Acropora millepora]|uniref:stimulator of interferon genes protein-like n=1 Tax=Acropora millepora TaxID=45264 RepID=UPI001CF3F8BF|nr:stimulator of interferon genes protein-like [Acropora millepora]
MDLQQENNGFGPIPKRRGEFAKGFAILFVVLPAIGCVIAVLVPQDKVHKDYVLFFPIFVTGRLLLSFVIGKIVQKICQFVEETRHFRKRYNRSLPKLFKSTFTFSYGDCVFIFVTVFLLVISYALQLECSTFSHMDRLTQFGILVLNSCWVALLSIAAGCREPSKVEISRINERENKNVADGLAWSYYFGYLKLVLPELDKQIGRTEQIRNRSETDRNSGTAEQIGESKFRVSRKKLYILLPKNCYTYETIDEADPRVTIAGNLEPYEMNRAGIHKRVYRHTVHRIGRPRPDGGEDEPYFLVLEYATPLMSLYDMSMNNEAALKSQERDEQVVLFYRKLKEILDKCPKCKNKYELVPIGDHTQIADVLAQKLKDADVPMEAETNA